MKEEFEKHIEQQLKHFQMQPSSMVWTEIEKALHPEKKRRVLPFWWLMLGIFLIVGCCFWFVNFITTKPITVAQKQAIAKSQQTNNLVSSTISIQKNNNELVKKVAVTSTRKKSKQQKISTLNENDRDNIFLGSNAINNLVTNKQSLKELTVKTNNAAKNIDSILSIQNNKNGIHFTDSLSFTNTNQSDIVTKDEAIETKDSTLAIVKSTNQPDTIKLPSVKKATFKKWYWNFSAGWLNINNGFLISTQKSEQVFASNSGSLGSVGTSGNLPSNTATIQPSKGLQLSFGVLQQTHLNKHWAYTIGVQYSFYHSKQTLSEDTALGQSSRLVAANNFGRQKKVSNYAHLLQVPVGLEYTFSPNKKHPISIAANTIFSIAFSKNWLITSDNYQYFYKNASLEQTYFVSASAGVFYGLNPSSKLGFVVQQSFTPIHQQVQPKLYFSHFSLQYNRSFSFNKKRK